MNVIGFLRRHRYDFLVKVFGRPFDAQLIGHRLLGVEVGVFKGKHAKQLIKKQCVSGIYCVDPYVNLPKAREIAVAKLAFSRKVA